MNNTFKKLSWFFMLIASFSLIVFLSTGCGVDSTTEQEDDEKTEQNTYTDNNPIQQTNSYKPNDGRLLGSQCAQCHGTNGISTTGWDSIAGEDEMDEIFGEHPIMDAQAKGYTQSELTAISGWLITLSDNDDNNYNDNDDDDDDDDDDDND